MKEVDRPITITVPNQQRMDAIAAIARSNEMLARALTQTSHVTITNCIFKSGKGGTGVAIKQEEIGNTETQYVDLEGEGES